MDGDNEWTPEAIAAWVANAPTLELLQVRKLLLAQGIEFLVGFAEEVHLTPQFDQ